VSAPRRATRLSGETVAPRVDVKQRKRQIGGIEGLERQMQRHARVLADGVEQHGIAELRRHFADDADRLGLQLSELRRQDPGGAGGAHVLTRTDA
jgi:hypothetical protein